MAPSQTLAEFVAHLKQAPTASRADAEDWSAHVNRISVPGRITEVSEEDYFLLDEAAHVGGNRHLLSSGAHRSDTPRSM